jgi:hypothetical protein
MPLGSLAVWSILLTFEIFWKYFMEVILPCLHFKRGTTEAFRYVSEGDIEHFAVIRFFVVVD